MFGLFKRKQKPPQVSLTDVTNFFGSGGLGYDGETFLHGWGFDKNYTLVNTRLLQARSLQLYRENSIAGSIFTLFQTSVINQGLKLNLTPINSILNLPDQVIKDKTREIEDLWAIFAKRKITKDKQLNFYQLTKQVYETVILSGDCVVVMEVGKDHKPVIQVVDGLYIGSSLLNIQDNDQFYIKQGIKFSKKTNEHISYFVLNGVDPIEIPVKTKGGRTRAFLVKNPHFKRINDIRGIPLLARVIQMINETGRNLASEQRAALVNSFIALIHTKAPNQKAVTKTFRGGEKEEKISTSGQTAKGYMDYTKVQNGVIEGGLQAGELIQSFDTKRPNVSFMDFHNLIKDDIAQSLDVPPEIVKRTFNSNYSASRQAYKMWYSTLLPIVDDISEQLARPIFELWLELVIMYKELDLPLFAKAYFDGDLNILDSWRSAIWRGSSDENIDVLKQMKANEIAKKYGWLTNSEITQDQFNGDFFANMKKLTEEEEMLSKIPSFENRQLNNTIESEFTAINDDEEKDINNENN